MSTRAMGNWLLHCGRQVNSCSSHQLYYRMYIGCVAKRWAEELFGKKMGQLYIFKCLSKNKEYLPVYIINFYFKLIIKLSTPLIELQWNGIVVQFTSKKPLKC